MLANRLRMGGKKYDSFTKTLLHFDTSANIDEIGKIWTPNGGLSNNTTNGKFGAYIVFGSAQWLDTPDSVDFTLGSADFTFDFWLKRSGALATQQYVLGQTDSSFVTTSVFMNFTAGDVLTCTLYNLASSGFIVSSVSAISDITTWHHIAIVRNGNTLSMYVDGASTSSTSVSGVTVFDSANKFAIGRAGEAANPPFNGNIDEFRFSKGIARWTANFTPPTAPY